MKSQWQVPRYTVIAAAITVVDMLFVAAILLLDGLSHVAPPRSPPDASIAVGWVGTVAAVVAFGSYSFLIKSPSIVEAKVNPVTFQVYMSFGVFGSSMLLWYLNSKESMIVLSPVWGIAFGLLWVIGLLLAYLAIHEVGQAIGFAIWAGVTVLVSFASGHWLFDDQVVSATGTGCALTLLIVGIAVVAASDSPLPDMLRRKCLGSNPDMLPLKDPLLLSPEKGKTGASKKGGSNFWGIVYALCCGVLNGLLMVPPTCFSRGGCIGDSKPYSGKGQPSVEFLPSASLGIAVAQAAAYVLFYGQSCVIRGVHPPLYLKIAGLPGFVTGIWWGLGNFACFYSTAYLGQTPVKKYWVGFPLTQAALVISGLWGILYFEEIRGVWALGMFMAGLVAILLGSGLQGTFG